MPDPNARRFTWIQLLVVLGVIVFVIGLLLPSTTATHHGGSNRIKCSSNLRQIGLAMKMYANDEVRTAVFPRTRYSKADAAHPTAFTKPEASNPFADDGPGPNDVTAAMFLIVRTQEITTDVFLCPMDANAERFEIASGKDIKAYSNFRSLKNLSYSMQNPYPTEAAVKAGFEWNDNLPADFAIMADLNAGSPDLKTVTYASPGADQKKTNSPNHEGDGQNVLYADGHVDWVASAWAGLANDNIYGHNAQPAFDAAATRPTPPTTPPVPVGIEGPAADGNDSILLPVATRRP